MADSGRILGKLGCVSVQPAAVGGPGESALVPRSGASGCVPQAAGRKHGGAAPVAVLIEVVGQPVDRPVVGQCRL